MRLLYASQKAVTKVRLLLLLGIPFYEHILLQICNEPERNILMTNNLFLLAPYNSNGVELLVIGR